MKNISDWIEKAKGYYRFVVASSVAFEIIITRHASDEPIEEAVGNLYLTGEWSSDESPFVFERELLCQDEKVSKLTEIALLTFKKEGW